MFLAANARAAALYSLAKLFGNRLFVGKCNFSLRILILEDNG
jgi:hypothetical protein